MDIEVLIDPLFSLDYLVDVRILAILVAMSDANGNISLSTKQRKKLEQEMGVFKTNFSNSIARIKDKGYLKGSRGEYKLNMKFNRSLILNYIENYE